VLFTKAGLSRVGGGGVSAGAGKVHNKREKATLRNDGNLKLVSAKKHKRSCWAEENVEVTSNEPKATHKLF